MQLKKLKINYLNLIAYFTVTLTKLKEYANSKNY